MSRFFFFFNDPATTEIYTLSLHDALPIFSSPIRHAASTPSSAISGPSRRPRRSGRSPRDRCCGATRRRRRSEEHTSELQSRQYLVCRLLLEKKKNKNIHKPTYVTLSPHGP